MSAYIYCPKCRDESFDVDTRRCGCGYDPDAEIDTLRAENERLKNCLTVTSRTSDPATDALEDFNWRDSWKGIVLLRTRIAELKASNAALSAALEFVAEERDAGRHDGLPEPCPVHDAETMFAVARAALAAAEKP